MPDELGDAELITTAREGDEQAYAELYRRHSPSALRFARSLGGQAADVEDVVADAFVRVLAALKGGNGPAEAFRPYLLSAVRNAFYDNARRTVREQPVDDLALLAAEAQFVDPVMAADESRLVATAFRDLPERWQVVLWHTEVENERAADVAPLLGISANAVAALAYRARAGLRDRYLQAHVGSAVNEHCRPTADLLAAYTRNRLSRTDAERVQAHLGGCGRCQLLFVELADVNKRLGLVLGSIVLGAGAASYVATGSVAAGGSGVAAGVALALQRILHRPETHLAVGASAAASMIALVLVLLPNTSPAPGQLVGPALAPTAPATTTAPPQTPAATPYDDGSASVTPTAMPTETPTQTSTDIAIGTPMAAPAAGLTATLEPRGSLVRGRPGLLLLTVGNSTTGLDATTVAVTAVISPPAGVTLRITNAGNLWNCSSADGLITCSRPDLLAGRSSKAHIHVSVAEDAADGVPSAWVSGPGVRPVAAVASEGVVDTRARCGAGGDPLDYLCHALTDPASCQILAPQCFSSGGEIVDLPADIDDHSDSTDDQYGITEEQPGVTPTQSGATPDQPDVTEDPGVAPVTATPSAHPRRAVNADPISGARRPGPRRSRGVRRPDPSVPARRRARRAWRTPPLRSAP